MPETQTGFKAIDVSGLYCEYILGALMTAVQRIHPSTREGATESKGQSYWVKIYAKEPYSIRFLGPFMTKSLANQGLYQHIEQLRSEGRKCISSFHLLSLAPPQDSENFMNHEDWLNSLMGDYLHLNIPE